jgi:hypothetical protein
MVGDHQVLRESSHKAVRRPSGLENDMEIIFFLHPHAKIKLRLRKENSGRRFVKSSDALSCPKGA